MGTGSASNGERGHVDQRLHPGVSNEDHLRGDLNAPVTLTVFGDYECPVSARLWRALRSAAEECDPFREVFRHFPLTNVHPHALLAAQAAEAAGDQGRFWAMHDVLFERQDALEAGDVAEYAGDLGLDVERLEEDIAYEVFIEAVRRGQRSGISSGVRTTPTIFADEERLVLAEPEDLPEALGRLGHSSVSDA
jgi:formate-nitrite transporter family protein